MIMTYFQIQVLLKIFQFIVIYEVIRAKLEILDADVVGLNKTKYSIKPKVVTRQLRNIHEFYGEVHDTVELINNTGAYTLLTISVFMASSFATLTYWLVLGVLKNIQVITLVSEYQTKFFRTGNRLSSFTIRLHWIHHSCHCDALVDCSRWTEM